MERRGWKLALIARVDARAHAPAVALTRFDLDPSLKEVTVAGDASIGLGLLLHELATNAVKYGAWSAAEGRVAVGWALRDDVLALTWRETGGPPVAVPARTGFGSRLIRQLAAQLGGEVRKDWRPEGLRVELTAAL